MKIKDLLIEYASEVGYIECSGAIMPPEHYSLVTSQRIITFIKTGSALTQPSTIRMFALVENGMMYIGSGQKTTTIDIRDPDSLKQFQEILEYGSGNIH